MTIESAEQVLSIDELIANDDLQMMTENGNSQ